MKPKLHKHKNLLIVIMVIAIFVFIVSLASLYTQREISCGRANTCTIPLPFLIPITASIGLLVGTFVFYLMESKIEKKDIRLTESSNVIVRLLSPDERNLIKILAGKNELTQAKLTSLSGMSRLKVFRTIEKLKEKELIEKKKKGKLRVIKIKENIKELIKGME